MELGQKGNISMSPEESARLKEKGVMPQRPKNIKFVLDRLRIEQEQTVARIFDIVRKKPYPTKEARHLATFVHALFSTAPLVKRPHLKPPEVQQEIRKVAKEMIRKGPVQEVLKPKLKPLPEPPEPHRMEIKEEVIKPMPEEPELPELDVLPKISPLPKIEPAKPMPTPSAEPQPVQSPVQQPKMQRREYVVNLFNTPIGVYVAPDEKTFKVTYRVIEPVINDNVLALTKKYLKNNFKQDYKVLDNDKLLQEKVQKACKKSDVQYTDDYTRKIKYYLKRDLTGFRRIDPMMQDPNVKAIYVAGVNKPVVVEFRDFVEKMQSNVVFVDANDLNVLISKLARVTGNEISEDKPILDTMFQGFKIQATQGVGGMTSKLIIKKVML